MTEMQVHEERVMNLVESSSGNPTNHSAHKNKCAPCRIHPADRNGQRCGRLPFPQEKYRYVYVYPHLHGKR